jgi:hypothetical protein
MAKIEIPEWINPTTVEHAHRQAILVTKKGHEQRRKHLAEGGMRAARARDPKLMLVLEHATGVLNQMAEDQYGRTRRDPGTYRSQRVELTEFTMWREAYAAADRGEPVPHFALIYGAAAELAGLL